MLIDKVVPCSYTLRTILGLIRFELRKDKLQTCPTLLNVFVVDLEGGQVAKMSNIFGGAGQ